MNQPRLYEPAYQSPAQLAQLEHQNRMAEFIGHVDRSMRHNFAALMESIRLLRVDNAELKTELTFHIRQKQRLSRRTERYRKEVSELKAGTRWTRKVAKPGNKGLLQVKVSTDLPCTSQAASAREEQVPQAQEESKLTSLKSRLNWETRGPKEGISERKEAEGGDKRETASGEKREAEGGKSPSKGEEAEGGRSQIAHLGRRRRSGEWLGEGSGGGESGRGDSGPGEEHGGVHKRE